MRFSFYFVLVLLSSVQALPRFATLEDLPCSTCHVNPAGGGIRNQYGSEYIQESLVRTGMLPTLNELKSGTGIPEGLAVGSDVRLQFLQGASTRFFPMQAAAYAGFEGDRLSAILTLERRRDIVEAGYSVTLSELPLDSWLSLNRNFPDFGLRLDDHTAFIRGGNFTNQALMVEGMPLNPLLAKPHTLALGGWFPLEFQWQIATGTSFLAGAQGKSPYQLIRLDRNQWIGPLTSKISLSYLKDDPITLAEVDILAQQSRFTYNLALTRAQAWPLRGQTSLAVFHEFSARITKGIDLIGRYEFFDPDLALANGALSRWAVGADLYPVAGLEWKILYRSHAALGTPLLEPEGNSQLLIQTHLYF